MHHRPEQPETRQGATIRSRLGELRARIRWYVFWQGLTVTLACLGAAFWASLVLDWFFEPPAEFRMFLLAAVILGCLAVLMNWVVRRLMVPLGDSSMALLLERHFPHLDESLLTAVELEGRREESDRGNPAMLAQTRRQAEARLAEVRPASVFDPVPLRRSVSTALAMMVTILFFAWAWPGAFGIWARRSLAFSDELWPRRVRIVVDGFEEGVAKVARGADLEIIARADLSMPLVPQVVQIRYRPQGGSRNTVAMNREGQARPDRDAFQQYSYTFRGVLAPIELDVHGGDCTVGGLRIEVVDNPTIVEMTLDCRYPDYMAREARSRSFTGVMQIPQGTEVTLRGRTNKPLREVRVESALEETPGKPDFARIDEANPREFVYPLGKLTEDKTLLFHLHDADEVRNREPFRVALAAVADAAPELDVELRGIGSAVTAQARIPVVGKVTDDYGLARAWFAFAVDQKEGQTPLPLPSGNPTERILDDALELADQKLVPGQKFTLSLQAADRYNLGKEPNIGVSQQWVLDVVTPEQLRAMLDARELVLRQRFEAILREQTETRDTLVRVEFSDAGVVPNKEEKNAGAEPGDSPETSEARSPEQLEAMRALRVERALQNAQKNAHETRAVAVGFEDVRLQLINNRVDTEEHKLRLEEGIIRPLKHIVDTMFPELERRLEVLKKSLDDPEAGPPARDDAKAQADAILVAMEQVLGRMIELEDFNEVIELLREIIEAQKDLRQKTQDQHKEGLRDLLED